MATPLDNRGRALLGDTTKTAREEAVDRNPFILPSDDDVFRMREADRKRKEDVRVRPTHWLVSCVGRRVS
jgi:hypothetical protein